MKTFIFAFILLFSSDFIQANPNPIPSKNTMFNCVKQFHLAYDQEGKLNLHVLKEKSQDLMMVIKGKSGIIIYTDFFENREKVSRAYDLNNYSGNQFSIEIFSNKELVYSNTFIK